MTKHTQVSRASSNRARSSLSVVTGVTASRHSESVTADVTDNLQHDDVLLIGNVSRSVYLETLAGNTVILYRAL